MHLQPRTPKPIAWVLVSAITLIAFDSERTEALPLINNITPSVELDGLQVSGSFGHRAATAGDVNGDGYSDLVVGAPTAGGGHFVDEGRAYIYLGSASGLSVTPARTLSGGETSARLGESVASIGDVNFDGFDDIAIGIVNGGSGNPGAVEIYMGGASGIGASPAVTLNGAQNSAAFGQAVAGAGDVNNDGFFDLLVGEPGFDNGQTDEGRAHVFLGTASGMSTTAAWTFEPNNSAAAAGFAVSPAGDVNGDGRDDILVGSFGFSNGQSGEGAAWVFLGTPTGVAVNPVWILEGAQAQARFGSAVGNAGDVNGDGYADILVGAQSFDNGQTDEGRAYLYLGSASGPATTPTQTFEPNVASAAFGFSVGTAGDVNGDGFADWMIGANRQTGDQTEEGKAFLYLGGPTVGSTPVAFTFQGNENFCFFGNAVGTAGDVNGDGRSDLLVGAPTFDGSGTDSGAVFVYHGATGPPATSPFRTLVGSSDDGAYGASAVVVGDVNADGYDDVAIGEPYFVQGVSVPGRVVLHLGGPAGLSSTPAQVIIPTFGFSSFSAFGRNIVRAGDVNADGFDDVLIGAPSWNGDLGQDLGLIELWNGSETGLLYDQTWVGPDDNTSLGESMAAADVNGDGFYDVIIGESRHVEAGHDGLGRVLIYNGSATGPDPYPDWVWHGEEGSFLFGLNVARAGDVNGDGIDDFLVAQVNPPGVTTGSRGFVSLFVGNPEGPGSTAAWTSEGANSDSHLGERIAGIGDVNADGYADVALREETMNLLADGRVLVYHGNLNGLDASPTNIYVGSETFQNLGESLSSAGDVNADGYSDLVIGAPYFWHREIPGFALTYLGGPGGLSTGPAWNVTRGENADTFGESVSGGGDFNGDGFSDLIVSAPLAGPTGADIGQALAYYGNDGDGLHRVPRQETLSTARRISTGSLTLDVDTGFRPGAMIRSAAGRSKVGLELEVRAIGEQWSSITDDTGFFDTTAPTAQNGSARLLDMTQAGLNPNEAYRWRMRFASVNPQFPHSPWMYMQGNSPAELDLRTIRHAAGVADSNVLTDRVRLHAPVPNPVRDVAAISFTLPSEGRVELRVHDVQGRVVRELFSGDSTAGTQSLVWDGRDDRGERVASGVYYARLVQGENASAQKIVIQRK